MLIGEILTENGIIWLDDELIRLCRNNKEEKILVQKNPKLAQRLEKVLAQKNPKLAQRLEKIKAMRQAWISFRHIGEELGISRQRAHELARRYMIEDPILSAPPRLCANPLCEKKFNPREKRSTQKYCSPECRIAAHKKPKVPKPCAWCGTQTTRRRFCCNECQIKYHSFRSHERFRKYYKANREKILQYYREYRRKRAEKERASLEQH